MRQEIGGGTEPRRGVARARRLGNRIARWNGSSWQPLGVHALASFLNELQVGGEFLNVRNSVLHAPFWARFSEDGIPWFARQPVSQTVDCGDNAGFAVHSAEGYGGLAYQWRRDGAPVALGPTGTGSTSPPTV